MSGHDKLAIIIVDFLFLSLAAQDYLSGLRLGGSLPALLLLRLEEEALAAHGHVRLGPAHQLQVLIRNGAQRETRLVIAKLANGVELLYFLGLWHQVKDRVEAFSLVSASEGTDDDNLAVLRGILTEIHDLYDSKQKLVKRSKQVLMGWLTSG